MSRDGVRFWVGFSKVSGIGAARLRALLDYFGELELAWKAPIHELQQAGLDRRSIVNLVKLRDGLDLEAEVRRLERQGVTVMTWEDADYPPNLRQVYNPPPVSYTHLRAHETVLDLVCRLLLEKNKTDTQ